MTRSEGEHFSMLDPQNQTGQDREFSVGMGDYFSRSHGTDMDKLRNFAKFVPRQALSLFMAKAQLFQRVLEIQGHIIECGVFLGGGLLTWAELSAIHEPYNHIRRIVGFDTFTGFPSLHEKDGENELSYKLSGGLAINARDDILEAIRLYDLNRPVGHIPRVQLVQGDAVHTIPQYIDTNKHLVVAMLYLDFDLYEPTRLAIETFLPRMPKGSVIIFDELNQAAWPGETLALLDTIGIRNVRIQRFPFTPQLSYAVLD